MKWLRILPPVVVLLIGFLVSRHLTQNPIEPPKRPASQTLLNVEAITLQPEDYQVVIHTQGNVEPHTETRLIPQVPGYITKVSPSFRDGGFFKKGDVLVEIDQRDYQTAMINAKANLAQARAALETEQAKADQAKENWESLGLNEEPTPLVLRLPQLIQAQANVASAEAQLEKATRDLERTIIKAPYDGRIRGKGVDVGQYVTPGTNLASIFAVDYVEVRLPIPPREAAFIDLPEQLEEGVMVSSNFPEVVFTVDDAGATQTWHGKIVRTEGVMDIRSRQIIAVAQIESPYAPAAAEKSPLKIGQFVRAAIKGNVLTNHFVLPRSAVREDNHIYLVTSDNKLAKRDITMVWTEAASDNVIIADGVKKGDILCLTPIPFAVNGMGVSPTIDGKEPDMPKRKGPAGGPGGGAGGGAGKGKGTNKGPGQKGKPESSGTN